MALDDDDHSSHNDSELAQEEQIQLLAKREKAIRDQKRWKQAQRRKWFRFILLFHRKQLVKENQRFEKHKTNLVNQAVALIADTFVSKTIFFPTDFEIGKKGVPSILPCKTLTSRQKYKVDINRKADRVALNFASFLVEINHKTPFINNSILQQSFETITPIIDLGFVDKNSISKPNKIEDADKAAPGAALNALPTEPPYTPKQAAKPLIVFQPVDYNLRRENRPYTTATRVAEMMFLNKQFSAGFKFLANYVENEVTDLRDLALVERDEYSYDDGSSLTPLNSHIFSPNSSKSDQLTTEKVDENHKKKVDHIFSEEEEEIIDEEIINIKKRDVKLHPTKNRKNNHQNHKIVNNEKRKRKTTKDLVKEKVAKPLFAFDNRKLKDILGQRTQNLIDDITNKVVTRNTINKKDVIEAVFERPVKNFARRVVQTSKPKVHCDFSFLDKIIEENINAFVTDVMPPEMRKAKEADRRKAEEMEKETEKEKEKPRTPKSPKQPHIVNGKKERAVKKKTGKKNSIK